jgi:hypothetical protein
MKHSLTEEELKAGGLSLLDEMTEEEGEAAIAVGGKTKYVVLTVEEYNRLRVFELKAAIAENKKHAAEGEEDAPFI